jgi:predicted enzyme related to lactoylglutathione lyase
MIAVTDQDKSIDFYVNTLGWELRTDAEMWPGARWVEVGPAGSQAGVMLAKASDFTREMSTEAGFTMATDDVQALYTELTAKGIEVTEPKAEGWGTYITFADPDGIQHMIGQQNR